MKNNLSDHFITPLSEKGRPTGLETQPAAKFRREKT
jgi:hypothetical protein